MTALLAYISAVAMHHRRDHLEPEPEDDEGSDFEVQDLRPASSPRISWCLAHVRRRGELSRGL